MACRARFHLEVMKVRKEQGANDSSLLICKWRLASLTARWKNRFKCPSFSLGQRRSLPSVSNSLKCYNFQAALKQISKFAFEHAMTGKRELKVFNYSAKIP